MGPGGRLTAQITGCRRLPGEDPSGRGGAGLRAKRMAQQVDVLLQGRVLPAHADQTTGVNRMCIILKYLCYSSPLF